MKILMATMGMDIGGAETHIVELAKQLKSQGHDIAIVSNGGVYVPEITAAGIRHYQAPLHRRQVKEMVQARSILAKVLRQEKPDVVHAHARIPAFLCGGLCRSMGIPFVTTAHWVFDTRGVLRHLTDWGEWTMAVSEDIKSYLIREYQLPPQRISVTINGIDTEKFSPEVTGDGVKGEFGLDSGAPILSYVSRMDEDRALVARQLIQIAPQLDRAIPGIQLLIAGGGNVFEELFRLAEETNAQLGRKCITMTGPRTDINQIVGAGQVFVGVSRAALEAMAAAKPVIVAGNEGYHGLFGPDKLEEAQSGNFCCRGLPLSTPELLLEDVVHAFSLSEEARTQAGAYGRQVIFDYYSVRRMAGDCLEMYRRACAPVHRVVMSGYYGYSNAGDDAILQSIHEGILAASDNIQVTVLSRDPQQTRSRYGLEAVPRFNLLQVRRALKNCDALLSGGGSLLQDRTSTRSLLYYLSIISWAKGMGKPVMLYANGIGPVTRSANRRMVRRTVEKADVITLRDQASARELEEMGVPAGRMTVTADPVFNLSPAPEQRGKELLALAGIPEGSPFVAVSVRDWAAAQQFPEQAAKLCDHLRTAHGLEVLFLLMQPAVDQETTRRVRQAMEQPSYVLDGTATPSEMMAVLGRAKLCLAMRLHTLIFAARMAVPTVGLVYDPKVDSYLKELDLPSAGEVENFDTDHAVQVCDRLLAEYDQILPRLRRRAEELSAAARKNEGILLTLLSGEKREDA